MESKNLRKSTYRNMMTSLIDLMYYIRYKDPEMQKYTKEFLARNGKVVTFRPLSPKDDEKVLLFYQSLSRETVFFRFFSTKKTIKLRQIRKYTRIDYHKQIIIVVEYQDIIIGLGHLIATEKDKKSAEMAVILTDAWHHQGIGTELLRYLIKIAREKNLTHLFGTIRRDNINILKTIEKLGFKTRKTYDHGDIEVEAYIS